MFKLLACYKQLMTIAYLLLIPILIVHTNVATASQCRSVDLSAGFGDIRHQGSTGWCYAFAAADLLGYWLKQQEKPIIGDEQYVSAIASAALYNFRTDAQIDQYRRFLEDTERLLWLAAGGYDNIFEHIMDDGMVISPTPLAPTGFDVILKEILSFYQRQVIDSNFNLQQELIEISDRAHVLAPDKSLNEVQEILLEGFNNGNDPIYQLLFVAQSKTFLEETDKPFIQNVYRCPYNVYGEHCVSSYSLMVKRIQKKVQEGVPVGISYLISGLIVGKYDFDSLESRKNLAHKSVIVGLKCEKDETFLILRNSWGTDECQKEWRKALDRFAQKENQFQSLLNPDVKLSCKFEELESSDDDLLKRRVKDGKEGPLWRSYDFDAPSMVSQACVNKTSCLRECKEQACRNSCEQNYYQRLAARANLPFKCKDGNYLIKSSRMADKLLNLVYLK